MKGKLTMEEKSTLIAMMQLKCYCQGSSIDLVIPVPGNPFTCS